MINFKHNEIYIFQRIIIKLDIDYFKYLAATVFGVSLMIYTF